MRSDTERNRRQLIRAAAELFASSPGPVKMSDIAKAAEVSTATAYRQFASMEEILDAFRLDVGRKLQDFSKEQTTHGMAKVEAVSRHWVSLVLEHGGAMVGQRSRRGYLDRLWDGTEYLIPQADAVRGPLSETAQELGLPDLGDESVFLWNLLFDPREILDLVNTVGLTEQEVGTQLVSALRGALIGWAETRGLEGGKKRSRE
ncbi:TetR family transcriptional regulator [Actinoallomurus vinaceus]|uniref:TetR family transcriptional regulator n=1 Tax=Actinoallomurus vinaceus TaxID=1080074 RepID=A0ABP8U982_9ACTN